LIAERVIGSLSGAKVVEAGRFFHPIRRLRSTLPTQLCRPKGLRSNLHRIEPSDGENTGQ
jgi:hypothetical protein